MMRTILIFGGAFDPPTLAHEAIMAACLALPQFDEVWVMPSGDRLDKQIGSSDGHRLAMLSAVRRTSFGNNPRLHISNFELALPRPTATHRTVKALKKEYPDTAFWFAFGRDSYINMSSWPRGKVLQRTLPMIIITSGPGPKLTAPNIQLLTIPDVFNMTSSTEVRNALQKGRDISSLQLSPDVRTYIKRHGLYLLPGDG